MVELNDQVFIGCPLEQEVTVGGSGVKTRVVGAVESALTVNRGKKLAGVEPEDAFCDDDDGDKDDGAGNDELQYSQ